MIDIQLIIQNFPYLLKGAWVSIQIAGIGCIVGMGLGTLLGLAQTSSLKFVRWLVSGYIILVRGTPMLIQILFAFYVLPQLGIRVPAFWAATLAIGLNSAAYISQIIRSGIASISKGQIEAAQVLGLNTIQITRYIILPQAIRIVLPALGNEFITLIKDSSLASTIGVAELTRQGALIRSRSLDAISVFCAIALLYLIMTTTLSFLIVTLEQRMNHHAKN